MLSEDQKPQNSILTVLLRKGGFLFFLGGGPMARLPNQPPVRDSSSHAPLTHVQLNLYVLLLGA